METKDREAILDLLRQAPMVSIGFIDSGAPFVIPMGFVLLDERLYIHGANASRMIKALANGSAASLSVAILDGIVLARSAFSHAMNYRSANIFGVANVIDDNEEKINVLRHFSDKYVPGRWDFVRPPHKNELDMTMILYFSLDRISGKTRKGPPDDLKEDKNFPVWAGEIPIVQELKAPIQDPSQTHMELPPYLTQ